MPNRFVFNKDKIWSRRQLLKLGLVGAAASSAGLLWLSLNQRSKSQILIPPIDNDLPSDENNPMKVLRNFDYGTIKEENGRKIREFRITAQNETIDLNSAVSFNVWTFNGQVPGPTLRAKVGDRVRIIFLNRGGHSHSMHFHGTHPASSDGVRPVTNGKETVYEFNAETLRSSPLPLSYRTSYPSHCQRFVRDVYCRSTITSSKCR